MEKYIVISSFQLQLEPSDLFSLKGGLKEEYICLEINVKKIGLWFLNIVVPLRS